MSFRIITWFLIAVCCLIHPAVTVSFYGESYIHIPDKDDFRETDLELRFKAARPYGVLFLIHGESDYFLLQLHAGILELKVNFGLEETLLNLGDQRLDDLQWHQLKIVMKNDVITMTIDLETTVRARILGDFKELNINQGIYMGGFGNHAQNLFGIKLKYFRGSISYLTFNNRDMIAIAKGLTDPSNLVEISWDNDAIFEAPHDSNIAFLSDTSFISFSHIHPTNNRYISFMVKTDTKDCVLVFSSTQHSIGKHFFALELQDSKPVLIVLKNEEILKLRSDSTIDGSKWHQIDISVTSAMIELSVNGQSDSEAFENKTSAIYGGLVFIGGINLKSRAQAFQLNLNSLKGDNSLKGATIGCAKDVVINSRNYNIHEIHSSRLIGLSCQENKPCKSGKCGPQWSAELTPHSDSNRDEFQLLAVTPLEVGEGGRKDITTDNIEIVYNYKELGIRESGIMIYVVDKPKHGTVEVDLGQRRKNEVFTYLDLQGKKVVYIHDGSEPIYDEVGMEIEIYGSQRNENSMPAKLQQRHAFVLPINVKPANDAPRIIVGNGGVWRIIENTKIRITPDLLKAEDSDTPVDKLVYQVIIQPQQGHFEKVGKIGLKIDEFTQSEINDRQISFVHYGDAYLRLQVKDVSGARSDAVEIRIQTVQLQLTVLKNTGLVLPHGTYGIISKDNLTTSSNVPSQEIEIRYEILSTPKYGILERQQYADGEWREVRTFAQRHIDNGHIRYKQTNPTATPSADQFSFNVKAKSYLTPYYYFRIQFEQVFLTLEANNKLTVLHQPFGILSYENLRARTNNPQLSLDKIKFTLIRQPSLGDFYRIDKRMRGHIDFLESLALGKDSTFSQEDINNEYIYYKLKNSMFEKVQDYADLKVHTRGTSPKMIRFWIEFTPLKSDIRFINQGLKDVIEGEQKAIDRHSLYIQTNNFSIFEFTVITPPQHGVLQLVDPRSSAVIDRNIKAFTNENIKDLELIYKHDDTEHDQDSFTFTAVPVIHRSSVAQSEIPEFTGTFQIQMLMRNDNRPERLVDKVFKIVRNKEKVIKIEDLAFTDPDIDYDTSELTYTRRGIPNGDIISTIDKSPLYQFKQRDIFEGKVSFRHEGEDFGRAAIFVTDGQFYSDCVFEVEAGDPYVILVNNTGLNLKSNARMVITAANISVDTNVNVEDFDIRFVLTEEPHEGHLEVEGREVLEFSLEDVKIGELYYRHMGGSNLQDYFTFSVLAGASQTQGNFSIHVMTEMVNQPPRVVNNHVLEIIGNERNVIKESHLLITHPDSTAENIEYLILVAPKYGRLFLGNEELSLDSDITFTQLDINQGHVSYQLDNTSGATDQFIFEVSNGFEALRGLEFLINIVQSTMLFDVKNITVREGGQKVLTFEHLIMDKFFYEQNVVTFHIKSKPDHGEIMINQKAVETFTSEDVYEGLVLYQHDDSDTSTDRFSVSASIADGIKESDVKTITVKIDGVNDEAPSVFKNEGLVVWKGSMTQITPDILCAMDPDTPANELLYRISVPSNGHVSLLNNTFKAIASFKQSMIDEGQIVFVHNGAIDGQFSFQVSDGLNNSPLTSFHVKAKQLKLSLDVNTLLNAYPRTIQPITASHLSASTNDKEQIKPVIYTVVTQSRHGSVVTVVGRQTTPVTSFTQEEIDNSQIFYKHEEKLNGWTQNDSVVFRVNTLYAEPLMNQRLQIYVSYGNLNAENKDQLIKTLPVSVEEGGEMIVTKNNLDVSEFVRNLERLGKRVSLRFTLKDQPRHGVLLFQGSKLLRRTRFSQRHINSHQLIYHHDDSNTIFDTFNLTLHLRIEDQSLSGGDDEETTFGLVLNCTIQPINDEPFKLLTTSPSLHIIQGFSAAINQSILNTVDKDTVPGYIVYSIIREAENGHVAFKNRKYVPIDSFTQQDINEGKLIFKHDGSSESGAFYFQVSDGAFKPYFKVFNIYVTQVSMEMAQNSTILITQSENDVVITQEHINVNTNGLRRNITFYVKKQPKLGRIYVNGQPLLSFSQVDIDHNLVVYRQENMKNSSDRFMCDIVYKPMRDIKISDKLFYIKVTPLVNMGPFVAPKGERVALTLSYLDANKLADRTADNPLYTITSGPFFGKIMKKTFTRRQIYQEQYQDNSGYKSVNVFTHEDVVYTKVFYESDPYLVISEGKDNFSFVLSAFNAQPATGIFIIGLSHSDNVPLIPVTKSTEPVNIPISGNNPVTQSADSNIGDKSLVVDDEVSPSRVNNNHVIVLAIIIPILVVIIIVVIIVYLVWRKRRKRDYAPSSKKSPRMRPQISGPYQVDQPNVHIEPQQDTIADDSKSIQSLVEYENFSASSIPRVRVAAETRDIMTPMMSLEHHHVPRSPDISRTEISTTVPNCKVTPLIDNMEEDSGPATPDDLGKSTSSMGDMIEWITSDPELLQHCSSSTPPVLQKNQYWV